MDGRKGRTDHDNGDGKEDPVAVTLSVELRLDGREGACAQQGWIPVDSLDHWVCHGPNAF